MILSIIMSTYNETIEEIKLAIESVLNQSYSEFEFIIVCDNPENYELINIIQKYTESDNRIIFLKNKKNIGLALSLNRAARHAEGKFLARMDADDISYLHRFEKQMNCILRYNYDLVCSLYDIIDENNKIIFSKQNSIPDKFIGTILPLKNIIHHPTVIMRKEAFEKVGGYRNFPCSQDYDLWLRMCYNGTKIHIMDDVLLQYRIRDTSISNRKKYQQLCTLSYIRKLYSQRLIHGSDNFSVSSYNKYLESLGVNDVGKEKKFLTAEKFFKEGKKRIKEKLFFTGCINIIKAFAISKYYRQNFMLILKRYKFKKIIKGE